jgi:hypothetical protein
MRIGVDVVEPAVVERREEESAAHVHGAAADPVGGGSGLIRSASLTSTDASGPAIATKTSLHPPSHLIPQERPQGATNGA